MDDKTQNDIPELKNLPKAVQDFIYDGAWENRTSEIAKKYSLNTEQTDTLIDTTLYVLIGLERPETFLETIIIDLGISRLLAEQVATELDNRVFDYAIKQIENTISKEKAPNAAQIKKPENSPVKTTPVPETRPNNLPMVEKGEVAHNNPIPKPRYIPTSEYKPVSVFQNNKTENTIVNKPEITPEIKQEPVQQPIPVPRFTAVPMEKDDAPETFVAKPKEIPPLPSAPIQNMMDQKLKTVTVGIKEEAKPKSPEKYTSDPYREPLV